MSRSDPNPFVAKHAKDAHEAIRYWHSEAADGRDKDFLGEPLATTAKAANKAPA